MFAVQNLEVGFEYSEPELLKILMLRQDGKMREKVDRYPTNGRAVNEIYRSGVVLPQ